MMRVLRRLFGDRPASPDHAAAHLAAVVDSADDAIVSKTLEGVITSWNRAAEALFGYSAREALGRSITIIIPPDRLNEETLIIGRIRRGEAVTHFETERVRKDGTRVPISLTVSPVRDAAGRIIGASKIARDISERQRAARDIAAAIRRLEVLYHLADDVGRAKDLSDVCAAAVDAVIAVGASRASVLLFDDAGVMRFQAWRNLSEAYRAAVDGHSPWSRDVSDPKPIIVPDVLVEPALEGLRSVITSEGIRSLAFVPLIGHGRLLGKFMFYYDAPHTYSADELRLAAAIASHVAFGFGRVLAESSIEDLLRREQAARRDAEDRRKVAEELARLARTTTETLDVAAVGQRIVDAALALFHANGSALRLAGPDGALVGVAFAGAMKEVFSDGHAIPAGAVSLSGLAMIQGEALWTDDSLADTRLQMTDDIRAAMTASASASVLAAPLRNKARVFGALSIVDGAGRRFSREDAETLQALAHQAALAIENAYLFGEAKSRQREAEVVAELAQRINASLDLQTTFERLVEGARELCDGDVAKIVVRDDASGQMLLRAQVGARWAGYRAPVIVEPGHGSGGIVLRTGKPFRTANYVGDPRISDHYADAAAADSLVTQIVVPIPGDSGIAGLLYVDRRTGRPFTDADEIILLRLADHAATAIRNGRLFAAERAARAEADAANRAKDKFLAVLSHELRTPLNAIVGWARMLNAGQLDEAQRAHAVSVITRNAHLQGQLVADLLDISRIAAGKMDIDRMPVDLVLVTREAIDMVAADAEAKALRLVTDLDTAAGEVLGEARRLQQVVSNLVSNAIKFTPPGGTIEVRLARHETSARLTVHDTGAGIDPGHLSRIFDPFEQADSTSTRSHQGLGLGLAIVRQLVELHGGTIRAESAGQGLGATFTVDLPVLAVRVRSGSRGPGSQETTQWSNVLRGLRVLIVDDQPDARELLALVLERRGATVHVASSAGEALDVVGKGDIDVLVSDLSMPEKDGYDLIREVRRLVGGGRIHAIALTAYTGHEVRERALAAGFDAQATKPLDPEKLVAALQSLGRR